MRGHPLPKVIVSITLFKAGGLILYTMDISYRERLLDTASNCAPDIVETHFSSLDKAIVAFIDERGRLACAQNQQDVDKTAGGDDLDLSLIEIHEDLTAYWQQFGFLNKSTTTAFLKMVKGCIMSYSILQDGDEDADHSDDDDS